MKRFFLLLVTWSLFTSQSYAQNVIVLQPGEEGKDATICTITPTTNNGATQKFLVMGWTFYGVQGIIRALIDFDLSEVPQGAAIDQAFLHLYFYTAEPTYVTHSGDNQAYLKLVTEPWEEFGVTWDNQPPTTLDHAVYIPPSTDPEQDYVIDVTSLVDALYSEPGAYHGMMLQLENELPYTSLMFASSDNEDPMLRPMLEVYYCYPPQCSFDYTFEDDIFSFTGVSPTATSWWWDFGDGYYSDLQNPMHQFWEYGTYTVCLTVEDSCGTATFCDTIEYLQTDPQTIIIQPGPMEGKDALLHSYAPGTNYGYSHTFAAMGWTFYGGNFGIVRPIVEFDLSAIPAEATVSEAWLDLYYFDSQPTYVPHTGDNEAYLKLLTTHWEEDEVTWNSPPLCTTDHMVYLPASTYPEQDYHIDVTDMIQATHESPGTYYGMMLQLQQEVTYTCLMFASSDCEFPELRPKLVVTYCMPSACSYTYEVDELRVDFTDETAMAQSWYWDFGDGYFSNVQNPFHYYAEPGNYTVCLTTTDNCGGSEACQEIDLTVTGQVPPAFSEVKLQPNPAMDYASIRLPGEGPCRVYLLNMMGQKVQDLGHENPGGSNLTIDVTAIPAGIYFVVLEWGQQRIARKLVVQH